TGDVHVIAPAAGSNVVDNPAAGRGQFHTAEEMHQNRLTGATPANNPQDLSSAISKEIFFSTLSPSKSMQRLSTVINGAFIIPLYLMWHKSHITFYMIHRSRHDRKSCAGRTSPSTMVTTSPTLFTT